MQVIDKLKHSHNALLVIGGAMLMLMVFTAIFLSGRSPQRATDQPEGKITAVTIENDTTKLKIKRNGVVEISSGDRVLYQYWEKDRVDRLFSLLEKTDFSGFDSRLKPGQAGYLLTLNTDQGIITVAIDADSDLIPDVIQELIDILEEITEQFNSEETNIFLPTPTPISTPSATLLATPTPTPPSPTPTSTPWVFPTPTPTPTPYGGNGGASSTPSPQQLFSCEYTGATGRFRVLSETLCDLIN